MVYITFELSLALGCYDLDDAVGAFGAVGSKYGN